MVFAQHWQGCKEERGWGPEFLGLKRDCGGQSSWDWVLVAYQAGLWILGAV